MTELSGGAGTEHPVIAIHAGAGDHAQELRGYEQECRQALLAALGAGRDALQDGDATHAVQAAIVVMEDFELFNAGRGSTLCSDGSVEMSAALMRGSDRRAGTVAVIKHTLNPIMGARAVFESSQVMMVGPAADERAAQAGVTQMPPEHFITDRQRQRLGDPEAGPDRATVGAVCRDASGLLAAGTSTGGVRGQPPGRVGDCPIIGAGTWADRHAAISCTGDGEAFIRSATARQVAALVQNGAPIQSRSNGSGSGRRASVQRWIGGHRQRGPGGAVLHHPDHAPGRLAGRPGADGLGSLIRTSICRAVSGRAK